MQPDVGLLHMNALTIAFSLDWKYCRKKPNLSLDCSSFSVSRALNLFSHQLQVKSKLFSCSQSNSLPAATHLRAFVIFLVLDCLSHTFLPTITGLRPLPLLSLLGDAVYLLFTTWAQQSLLTSSCASSIWHCIICIRAHILDGRSPVLFLAPPQGETPGTLCIWRHGQRHSDSGGRLCPPFFLHFFSCIEVIRTESRKPKNSGLTWQYLENYIKIILNSLANSYQPM